MMSKLRQLDWLNFLKLGINFLLLFFNVSTFTQHSNITQQNNESHQFFFYQRLDEKNNWVILFTFTKFKYDNFKLVYLN